MADAVITAGAWLFLPAGSLDQIRILLMIAQLRTARLAPHVTLR
ncbi:MAG TPA: hypothetical protein VEJ20_10415 [Candidatus Eremiobacteraceae bacterium]|nr:hypothetical protein [Candidatus Eremiobacteraceae bacterium]